MTIVEQNSYAINTKDFLSEWGLKSKYVAMKCEIPEGVFSRFLNGKAALSSNQLGRVIAYTDDYVRRNA